MLISNLVQTCGILSGLSSEILSKRLAFLLRAFSPRLVFRNSIFGSLPKSVVFSTRHMLRPMHIGTTDKQIFGAVTPAPSRFLVIACSQNKTVKSNHGMNFSTVAGPKSASELPRLFAVNKLEIFGYPKAMLNYQLWLTSVSQALQFGPLVPTSEGFLLVCLKTDKRKGPSGCLICKSFFQLYNNHWIGINKLYFKLFWKEIASCLVLFNF